MAHVEDRWYRTVKHSDGTTERVETELFGKGLRYRVRYIDPAGKERSKSFPNRQKRAADDFLTGVESAKLRGTYLDPAAGRTTFREYATGWLAQQTFDESSREVIERRLRRGVLPHLGDYTLDAIKAGHVREMDRALQVEERSTSYRLALMSLVATILNCAVDDERIAKNPCHVRSLRRPKIGPSKVIPWERDRVVAVRAGLLERVAVAVDLGAGGGLRVGEIVGFGVDGIDLERQMIHVVRQIKIVGNRLVFALPKGRKTRDVPLSPVIAERLNNHMRKYPPVSVTLPWDKPGGQPTTVDLVITGKTKAPLSRSTFTDLYWWPAALAAGVPRERQNGVHALRHYFASVLLDGGESIKALAAYLGHSDAGFTLRTYTHLMPSSEERTRRAIGQAFADGTASSDGLATA